MKVAVVIPCFKVKKHILSVIENIGEQAEWIFVIDDCCPEKTGQWLQKMNLPRVKVIYHEKNKGVGGAVITGFREVLKTDATIAIKIDGDEQMDPKLIPYFITPILRGECDYTKGNRFFDITSVESMPFIRKIGNLGLSFLSKFSSGYWHVFDPTNGYVAIHTTTLSYLPLSKLSQRFFFESDLLFRLNSIGAKIIDIPMDAVYSFEESNLKIGNSLIVFSQKHLKNLIKRIFYNYFLRELNIGSICLLVGILSTSIGGVLGTYFWIHGVLIGKATSSGSVMLAALPIILGFQLIISFINYDMSRANGFTTLHLKLRKKNS